MSKTTNDSLSRAIAALGAVEVAPGVLASENLLGIGWWTFKHARVEALAEDLLDPRVLSWPSLGAVKMPAWWSPSQRFAWRLAFDDVSATFATEREAQDAADGWAPRPSPERITADLATGEEAAI